MWKKIKRIFKMALLLPVLVAFAKGEHVQDPDPELLTTDYSDEALAGLEELAYGELPTLPTLSLPSVDLPSISLPGMTGQESQLLNLGMGLIEQLMSGQMPEAFTLGMDKIKSVLSGEYDPRTSPYYEGIKQEAKTLTEEGIGGIRQAGQLGGMLYSEPRLGEESRLRGQIGTGLLKTLGGLYERDIDRQVGMIPQLLGYSGQQMQKPLMGLQGISALSPLAGKQGDIGRQQSILNYQTGIDQQMFNVGQQSQQAIINQQIGTQQAMMPYTVAAPIMESLANWGTWSQPTTHYEPGILDYILGFAGAFF